MRSREAELYERLLEEKQKQVELMAEQVDYLRAMVGYAPLQPVERETYNEMELPAYMSEEEEDLREMAARQVLSADEAEVALNRVFSQLTYE